MRSIKEVNPKAHERLRMMDYSHSLMRYPRLKMQAEGILPPTFGRVASFAEQGMSQNVPVRSEHPVQSVLTYIKKASVFYSKQVQLLKKGY